MIAKPWYLQNRRVVLPRAVAGNAVPLRLSLPFGKRLLRSLRYTVKRAWWSFTFVAGSVVIVPLYLVIGLVSMRKLGEYLIVAGLKLQKYPW